MKEIFLKNELETIKLGKLIAKEILKIKKSSIEIHLDGDLGSGKTCLSRSIINDSGWNGLVKSPTYTLCEEYELEELMFLHVDLYRTNESEDINIFNLERKTSEKKIIIIEWPQKLINRRDFDLKIFFEYLDCGRKVSIDDKSNLFSSILKNYE